MKNKKGVIIIGVILSFVIFLQISFAEIKKVEVRIDGLSCPFCVWGLKQQMKRITSIEKLEVSLKKGRAYLTLKEKSLLNIPEIKDAVKNAGFSVRDIRIEVVGEIVAYDELSALKVRGSEQIFVLGNLKKINPGSIVLIEGDVHEHAEGKPYGLSIEKIKPINDSL